MKKVSLEDISKELGVSKTLISFVMNGRAKEMRVSEAMAEKILNKANEMGYRPHHMARALRTGKSFTLGLIVADISNPFFAKLARSIENEAARFDYHVIFGSSDEQAEKSQKMCEVFLEKKVDGLLICPSSGDLSLVRRLKNSKIPFVLIDRYFEEEASNVVIVDNEEGSFQLLDSMIRQGHRKIGYIGFKFDLINASLRLKGYRRALSSNGLNYQEELVIEVPYEGIEKGTKEAVRQMLLSQPDLDAIFFGNNHLAFLGLEEVLRHNKNNQKKVAMGSFDGLDLMKHVPMKISYGKQPIEKIGRSAVSLMMKQLNSETPLDEKNKIPLTINHTQE